LYWVYAAGLNGKRLGYQLAEGQAVKKILGGLSEMAASQAIVG
jgi:hypothetical protein